MAEPFGSGSKVQARDQLINRATQLSGHVLKDLPEGADSQWFVGGNREVLLLSISATRQTHVTARLS